MKAAVTRPGHRCKGAGATKVWKKTWTRHLGQVVVGAQAVVLCPQKGLCRWLAQGLVVQGSKLLQGARDSATYKGQCKRQSRIQCVS